MRTRTQSYYKDKRRNEPFYVVPYQNIDVKTTNDKDNIIKRCLTELDQKNLKSSAYLKNIKRRCMTKDGKYKCPRCFKKVDQLTNAHKGKPRRQIIQEVMNQTNKRDILFLQKLVIYNSNDVEIAVVCSQCNREIEEITK